MSTRIAAILFTATVITCGGACAGPAADADEQVFLARCEEKIQRAQQGEEWGRDACRHWWRQRVAAGPMAEAIIALAPAAGAAPLSPEQVRAGLPGVQWADDGTGTLGELRVHLPAGYAGISFYWQRIGAEVQHDVIGALRARETSFRTLGCPQYPGATMGSEVVLEATLPGKAPFTLAVYLRPAPAGFAPGVYAVDADFSGRIPDLAALRAGRYPGGGSRNFAAEPVSWSTDCQDIAY